MGNEITKILQSCINRDSECATNCGHLNCYYCCDCEGGSINISSYIEEEEEEEENTQEEEADEQTPSRRISRHRRTSEN